MRTITNAARTLNLHAAHRLPAARRLPFLFLLTDAERLADPMSLLARLPRGAGVILRDYGRDYGRDHGDGRRERARTGSAWRLARACRQRGLILIVAGDARLARAIGAAGLHLPEWMARRDGLATRRARAPGMILTVACHSAPALRKAQRSGADAALLAPVLPTASHPGAPCLGTLRFAALARGARLPVYALGGIDEKGARRIRDSGAAGIAGIGFATTAAP